MNAVILCVGKLKERYWREAAAEYAKRLTRYGRVTVEELPDLPEPANSSPALEAQLREKEGRAILARIRPEDDVVALCIDGERPDSVRFARDVAAWSASGRRTVFVIGGSLGLSDAVIARAQHRLSFSPMTFPHQLARVMLLEQLYRAAKISAGERYHK